jgi:hypothetical protein
MFSSGHWIKRSVKTRAQASNWDSSRARPIVIHLAVMAREGHIDMRSRHVWERTRALLHIDEDDEDLGSIAVV